MTHIPRTPEAIAADRARYAASQKNGLEAAPRALPGRSPLPAPEADPAAVIARETVPGGWYWTTRLRLGETLRITPVTTSSTVTLAAWAAGDPFERLNLPDTVKVQWTTELGRGRVLFSDMGRVMLSIIEDSCGAHDALTGGSTPATNARYGDPRLRNSRDNLLLAAAKLGLDRRDIPATLSLFAPVRVDGEGRFEWRPAMLSGRDWVALRAEMELFVALSICPHPLDPDPLYAPQPMVATRLAERPVPADDPCRTVSAEAVRGFQNNARA